MILSRYLKHAPAALILLLVCFALIGCGSGSRAPVEGSVTLDGQPVDGGTIAFVPEDYKEGGVEHSIAKADIKNGKYSLDATNGPIPGKYRVDISWKKKTGKQVPDPDTGKQIDEVTQVIPKSFNQNSPKVDIKASGNKFDYAIVSNPNEATGGSGNKPGPTRNRD
jgi:hypothetical protein